MRVWGREVLELTLPLAGVVWNVGTLRLWAPNPTWALFAIAPKIYVAIQTRESCLHQGIR